MGNSHGGNKTQEKIDLLNARSGRGNSDSPDTVTLGGFNSYINQNYDFKHDTWRPQGTGERVKRYHDIEALSTEIGMSEKARGNVLAQAYKTLNGRDGALERADIVDPSLKREVQSVPNSNAPSNSNKPSHPEELSRQAVTLALNPHSYSSLSGMNAEKLLALDTRTLDAVVHADNAFVEQTRGHWNLPGNQQQATALNVKANYNADLCHNLGLAGQTNATPTEAFVNGKDALLKAVNMGFDVYGQHTGHPPDDKALKAFGQVAMSVNLATSVSTTLTGRGADTISENTMAFSADGHSMGGSGPKKFGNY